MLPYHSEKLLKAVNNTSATEIWWLLICQNCQMICWSYYWDKQYGNISPLILMADWLMARRCSQKTAFHFLSVFYGRISILSAGNYFCEIYFWIVTNKRYVWDVSETSQNKHLFWDMFETLKYITWKTSFLRCIWDVLKTSQKRHLFWNVFEMS